MEQASGCLAQKSSKNGFMAQEERCGVQEYVMTVSLPTPFLSDW